MFWNSFLFYFVDVAPIVMLKELAGPQVNCCMLGLGGWAPTDAVAYQLPATSIDYLPPQLALGYASA